jgi:acyl-[acyl-carrier-protein]-phospholipid O-acyltransferase/long-chain-fatty-acid--[acyl-carrier-protein] ligase
MGIQPVHTHKTRILLAESKKVWGEEAQPPHTLKSVKKMGPETTRAPIVVFRPRNRYPHISDEKIPHRPRILHFPLELSLRSRVISTAHRRQFVSHFAFAMPSPAPQKNLTVIGHENLPSSGGFLLIPSRLNFEDLQRLEFLLTGREIVYLVENGAAHEAAVQSHLEKDTTQALVIVPETTDIGTFRRSIGEATKGGAVVVYVPATAATVPAPLTTVPGAKLEFLIKAEVPVLPLHIHSPREVAMAVEPTHPASESVMAFGPLLDGEDLSLASYQEQLLSLSEQCFSRHPALNWHLGLALLRGFKKHGSRNYVVDGKDDRKMPYSHVLAAACALSRHIKTQTNQKRVGVILPPGIGGLIANMAVIFAGKIPVNFNFTAGRAAVQSALRQSGVDHFVTADTFVRKMQAFPWPPLKQMTFLERLMPSLKKKIALWLGISKILPAAVLAKILGVPSKGGDAEALLLFTSGSSGEPKGVALTHRNILANVAQFGSRLNLSGSDSVLGSLPLFHSFGCTVTLWYPIIQGLNLVTYPSPLETKKLAELIAQYNVTLMLATPTFLRGYLRGVNREQLAPIKLCVTGAEKLPATVAQSFETRFGKRVFEGYGLTETSPVSNVNLPDPTPVGKEGDGHAWLPAYRLGSVGQMIPGLAVRITHPETNAPQSIHQSGMIWFKGANIFRGYLNDPKRSASVLDKDGWFRTGDIGRVDMDGFLYIEGRLSRFSKIAGEMVPHETVEEALVKAMGLEGESNRRIAVVGVPDLDRGEALVLLTTLSGGPEQQEILDLRYRLLDCGVPPLWIPKKMIRISEIPVLASGKLDVQGCEKIAAAGS